MLFKAARLLRDRRGATTVEIGFTLPIFLALLLGTFEFGRLFFTWSTIQYATEQTGRFAMSKPAATASELSTYLKTRLPGIVASMVAVNVTPETDAGVNYMVIVARVHFSFMSIFPIDAVDLEGRSRVPMVI
jgi:Flp pilus assembly protein TadG